MARRGAIVDHTQYLFALLSAEIALNKGDITSAIGTYLHVLRETHDPQVAERAMELSISVRAYPVADAVYKKWLETKPEATPSDVDPRALARRVGRRAGRHAAGDGRGR